MLYILESGAVLSLLYLIYIVVLSRETFFGLNRSFLLGILVFAMVLPLLRFDFNSGNVQTIDGPMVEISKLRRSYYDAMATWEFESSRGISPGLAHNRTLSSDTEINLGYVTLIGFFVIYVAGVLVCLLRMIWTVRWLWKMSRLHPRETIGVMNVIRLPYPIPPFSFFSFVFVYENLVNTPGFEQILAHEKTHVRHGHSVDLIFAQLLAAFQWFNPFVWKLIKSLKTTHEYEADKRIVNSGYSLVEYQAVLLSQLIGSNSYGLVHNFNLSFIKKRIAMMKTRKSGWSGRIKVALAVMTAALFGAVILQCNSEMGEQGPSSAMLSPGESSNGISLPVLPATGYSFKGTASDLVELSVAANKVMINGEACEVGEIIPLVKKAKLSDRATVIVRIDGNQAMGLVRDVMFELRKAERRLVLYLGQTENGEKVEVPLLLPPTPENAAKYNLPMVPDPGDLAADGKIDLLKFNVGDHAAHANQKRVYDFVMSHMAKNSADFVVSLHYADDAVYRDYLANLIYIQEGFNKIYQERARNMFGKDYYETSKDESRAVRKGIPMAISIAE